MLTVTLPASTVNLLLGCRMAATTGSAAPHLDEYFKVQAELAGAANDLRADPYRAMSLVTDPTKLKEFRDEQAKKVDQLREIIPKSFEYHDTTKDGVLSVEESQVLFTHFVERLVPHTTRFACKGLEQMIDLQANMMKQALGDDEAKVKEVNEKRADALRQAQEQVITSFKEKEEAYTSDKVAKDAAAFAVLDKNGDGKLTKEMVVDGLCPGTDIHYEFMVALGMMTKEEVEHKKQMEGVREALIAQAGAA